MADSIFAMELCFPLLPGAPLLDALWAAVPAQAPHLSAQQKWEQYHRVSDLLLRHLSSAVAGCWDYFDEHTRALQDFAMWQNGLVNAPAARRGPHAGRPGEPRYLTFTMALLLQQGSPSDLTLRAACDIPEAYLWQRTSFARILSAFGYVSFASVQADVAYVVPGNRDWALTDLDLADPKFQYLRRLM